MFKYITAGILCSALAYNAPNTQTIFEASTVQCIHGMERIDWDGDGDQDLILNISTGGFTSKYSIQVLYNPSTVKKYNNESISH